MSKRPLGRTFGPRYLDDSSCVVSMEYAKIVLYLDFGGLISCKDVQV